MEHGFALFDAPALVEERERVGEVRAGHIRPVVVVRRPSRQCGTNLPLRFLAQPTGVEELCRRETGGDHLTSRKTTAGSERRPVEVEDPADPVCFRRVVDGESNIELGEVAGPRVDRFQVGVSAGQAPPEQRDGSARTSTVDQAACLVEICSRGRHGGQHSQSFAETRGAMMHRALISSGWVAPGRRIGSRRLREKIATALSRRQHGPGERQAKHRPVALDVTCTSRIPWASTGCSSAEAAQYMFPSTSRLPTVWPAGHHISDDPGQAGTDTVTTSGTFEQEAATP